MQGGKDNIQTCTGLFGTHDSIDIPLNLTAQQLWFQPLLQTQLSSSQSGKFKILLNFWGRGDICNQNQPQIGKDEGVTCRGLVVSILPAPVDSGISQLDEITQTTY
jgi:hypothetical protein